MRVALGILAALVLAAPAQAATAELMVVGRADEALQAPKRVTLKAARVRVGRHRCAVGARTPLGVLARTRLDLQLRDYGSCSAKRSRDAAGLYVRGIEGQREKGRSGWVYKLGRRAPSTGAGDPASKVKAGARVLWFWCRSGKDGCQRTLEVQPETTRAPFGDLLTVRVMGDDDNGHGVPVAGATVTLGDARGTTGDDGRCTLIVPVTPSGTLSLTATRTGSVPAFPVPITIGP